MIDYDPDDPFDGVCPECGEGPYDCKCYLVEECGRWRNGRLYKLCTKAGSEECEFECPLRGVA